MAKRLSFALNVSQLSSHDFSRISSVLCRELKRYSVHRAVISVTLRLKDIVGSVFHNMEDLANKQIIFRINDSLSRQGLLTQVCLERGWKEYNASGGEDNWNLWWKTGANGGYTRPLNPWQYTNHVPKSSTIGRKDNLARYLRCMKSIYGSIYDFTPQAYTLPVEYTKLAEECNKSKPPVNERSITKQIDDRPVWISKPASRSQGKGIHLFRKLSDLNYDTTTIVQKYIERPLLIGGYKFDLRLYVCITCYHPLTIYLYREGLTRFGTDKFSLRDLSNRYRHLTNSSINKNGPHYTDMKERIGSGCKWTLKRLRQYFEQIGLPDWFLWQRISSLVVLTMFSYSSQVPYAVNCFDLLGFDVLIDEDLKPWLLEVNTNPALTNDCEIDRLVKKPMLHDLFDLIGLPIHNTGLGSFNIYRPKVYVDLSQKPYTLHTTRPPDYKAVSQTALYDDRRNETSQTDSAKASGSTKRLKNPMKVAKHNFRFPNHRNARTERTQSNVEVRASKTRSWGNGRNWNLPEIRDGDWMRIWPMKPVSQEKVFIEPFKEVKNMVIEIVKYNKIARRLQTENPFASDTQLSNEMKRLINLTTEMWLPPS